MSTANPKRLTQNPHPATYYAKERRDLLAEAIRKWGLKETRND